MILEGIITKDGYVELEDGRLFQINIAGTSDNGFPEVLIDSTLIDDKMTWQRKSIEPYIGMKCEFILNRNATHGYNFKIIK